MLLEAAWGDDAAWCSFLDVRDTIPTLRYCTDTVTLETEIETWSSFVSWRAYYAVLIALYARSLDKDFTITASTTLVGSGKNFCFLYFTRFLFTTEWRIIMFLISYADKMFFITIYSYTNKRDLKLTLSKYIQNKIRIVKSTAKLHFKAADAPFEIQKELCVIVAKYYSMTWYLKHVKNDIFVFILP